MSNLSRLIRDVGRVHHITVLWIGLLAGALAWPLLPVPVGLFFYFLGSGAVAFAYASILRSAHRSGVGVGLHLALFHWSIASTLVGFVSPYGLLFFRLGWRGGFQVLVAHMIYGACVGFLFDRASIRMEYPRSLLSDADQPQRDASRSHRASGMIRT